MNLPQSIIDAYEEERGRFDGYKGPLFRAVSKILERPKPPSGPGLPGGATVPVFGSEDCPSRVRFQTLEEAVAAPNLMGEVAAMAIREAVESGKIEKP